MTGVFVILAVAVAVAIVIAVIFVVRRRGRLTLGHRFLIEGIQISENSCHHERRVGGDQVDHVTCVRVS